MPSIVRAGTAALPPARMIDPRGHRFGAGVSASLLVVSFVAGWWVPAAMTRIWTRGRPRSSAIAGTAITYR